MITDGLNPFTLLLFIGLVLGGIVLAALYVGARFTGRPALAGIALRVGGGGVGAYAFLFLAASLTSRSRALALGEEKHICEIDCHLAYSVVGVKTASQGPIERYTVTLRVRFDEETISRRRPRDMALLPNSRYVALVDAEGRRYPASTDGLKRPLIPGESYTTELVFDVEACCTQGLHLILRNDDFETRFVVGHENSLFHGKTTFRLGAS
jgi:hypothetical protein